MRTARSLLAGAALTACLAFAAPAAHATGAVNQYDPSGSSSTSSAGTDSSSADSGYLKNQEKTGGEDTQSSTEGHKPHGGMHTGGGGLSLTSGSSLAAGSVLLVGGLGAGAWALRRRGTSGAGAMA